MEVVITCDHQAPSVAKSAVSRRTCVPGSATVTLVVGSTLRSVLTICMSRAGSWHCHGPKIPGPCDRRRTLDFKMTESVSMLVIVNVSSNTTSFAKSLTTRCVDHVPLGGVK